MSRWAVEARIFNSGRIVAKIRAAEDGEESGFRETSSCDVWVDVFNDRDEAGEFMKGYRKA